MQGAANSGRRTFLLAWSMLALAKIGLAAGLQPFGDEAFYWMESQRLALAYSDLPGATAWLIAFGGLVGEGVLGLRWPFLAIGLLIPWQVVWLSRCWCDARSSWLAGTLAVLMPLTGLLGVLALPDVPLTFATLLSLHAVARLQQHMSSAALAQLAAGLVLGALCHYRFIVVIAALAFGLLLSGAVPRLIRSNRFRGVLLLGALAWLPLLLFNLQNAGAGIGFQLLERHPWQYQPEGWLQPLVQALVVSPLIYLLLLAALWQSGSRWRELGSGPAGLQFGFALVPMLGYFLLGFFADNERVSFHWVLPGYLPLLVLAANDLSRNIWLRWASLASATLFSGAALAYLLGASAPSAMSTASFESKWFPANFSGWKEVAQVARRQAAALPDAGVIVADNFMLAAQLEFSLPPAHPIYALDHSLNRKHGRATQLLLWERDETALAALPRGTPALFIAEQTATKPSLQPAWQRRWCDQFGALEALGSLSLHQGHKRFLVYRGTLGETPPAQCARPAMARFYGLQPGQRLSGSVRLRGWAFKDGSGLDRVEISLDGEPLVEARYGLDAAHVAGAWPESDDPNHPLVGFEALLDLSEVASGDYRLGVRTFGAGRWEEAHTLAVRIDASASRR